MAKRLLEEDIEAVSDISNGCVHAGVAGTGEGASPAKLRGINRTDCLESDRGTIEPVKKTQRLMYSDDDVEKIVNDRVRRALLAMSEKCAPVPRLLREVFTPNDPVHGLIHLPAIVKMIVDTRIFQRMRHIRQLGICSHVYPGATHNRFFHSIGTAFLAHELMKGLRQRQPELGITDRDVLCATLAALCHDLGHPSFSHMFEMFVHELGRERRQHEEKKQRDEGRVGPLPEALEEEIRRYETFTHEAASVKFLDIIFEELEGPLAEAGLRVDAEGDDFVCIRELIDPPKNSLEELMDRRLLRREWSKAIRGRPADKAWMYEVVSNWRSGIDVDKFDYFRRDALYLGIHREFDHNRYLMGIKVINDSDGVPTISPPEKDRDSLRDNMLELRKMLHRTAYQHKTVKKLELHMIDILKIMDKATRVTGTGGKKMSMSEAAANFDPVAYAKLTDSFVETRLVDGEDLALQTAAAEYDKRIVNRELMRLVGDWDLPRREESAFNSVIPLPKADDVIRAVSAAYAKCAVVLKPEQAERAVDISELRCQVASFSYGMGAKDPISRVLFHSTKDGTLKPSLADAEAKPLRQKVFFFWNPVDRPSDELTLQRLNLAFKIWATNHVDAAEGRAPTTTATADSSRPSPAAVAATSNCSLAVPGGAAAAAAAPRRRCLKSLKIQASCPAGDDAVILAAVACQQRAGLSSVPELP